MSGTTHSKTEQLKVQGNIERRSREISEGRKSPDAHSEILALQQSAGNQAVSALMQGAIPSMVQSVINSGGQPIEPGVRAQMESRFGHDFTDVRVHADSRAMASAEELDAKAYTAGRDVVFGEGSYQPGTMSGALLLAHELTHVVQQRRGGPAPPLVTNAPHERSADAAAKAATDGNSTATVSVSGATGVGVARAPKDRDKKRRRPEDMEREDKRHVQPDKKEIEEQRRKERERGQARSTLRKPGGAQGKLDQQIKQRMRKMDTPSFRSRNPKNKDRMADSVAQTARDRSAIDRAVVHQGAAEVGEKLKEKQRRNEQEGLKDDTGKEQARVTRVARGKVAGTRLQASSTAGKANELAKISQESVERGGRQVTFINRQRQRAGAQGGRTFDELRDRPGQALLAIEDKKFGLPKEILDTPKGTKEQLAKARRQAQGVMTQDRRGRTHSDLKPMPRIAGRGDPLAEKEHESVIFGPGSDHLKYQRGTEVVTRDLETHPLVPEQKKPPKKKGKKGKGKSEGAAAASTATGAKPASKPRSGGTGGSRKKKSPASTKGAGKAESPSGTAVETKPAKHGKGGPTGTKGGDTKKVSQTKTGGAAAYDTHGDVHTKSKTSTKAKPPVKQSPGTTTPTGSYGPNRAGANEMRQRVKAEKARPPTTKAERPHSDKHPHPGEGKYPSSKATSNLGSSAAPQASSMKPATPKAQKPPAPAGPSPSAVTKSPAPPAAPSAQAPKAQAGPSKAPQPKAAAPPASNLHAGGITSPNPQAAQAKSGTAPRLGTPRSGQPAAAPAKAQVKQPATAPKPPGAAKSGGAPAARRGPVINATARPDGSVTAEVREKPGTSPTRYEVTVKVMLGGSANVSASQSGKRGSIGAHAGVSGSVTWSNTYDFSEEQKNAYLAAVNGDTASPYQEIEAAKAWAKGNREQAKSLLNQLGGKRPSAQDILNMPEGSSSSFDADTRAEGGVNASVKAISVGASGSVSTQNGWRNEHRDGRYFLSRSFTVEKGKSFDAAAGPGLWSMGYRADSSVTHSTMASFEVKDDDPEVRAKVTAITSAHSMEDLGKLALSRKDLGGSLTVTKGSSSGGTIKVAAADDKVSLEMGEEGFKSDSVTRDAEGNESHTFEGGSQDSAKFRFKGHEGPGVSNRSSIRTTVDPHGKASGETLGEKSETDSTASLKQAASHPIATLQAGARGDTQAIVKKSTDIKGMNLQDQNYDRLAQLSERPDLWSKEGSYFGPKDYVAWMRLRPSIEKAHGNREAIAKLLQNFKTQGDDRRRQMLEGAMDVGEGTRFEFPNVIKDHKEVFDRLVVHNPMGRAAELAEAGKRDEAVTELKRVGAELDDLRQMIESHRSEINASVLGEMISRISARRGEVSEEISGLAPQAKPKTGAADAGTDAANAQAEEARQREGEREKSVAQIKRIASNIKSFQQEEQDLFALIERELNPKSEGFFGGLKTALHTADTPLITTKLNELKKLYNERWKDQLDKLKDALQKAGLSPDVAENGKPNWDKWNDLNKEASRLNR